MKGSNFSLLVERELKSTILSRRFPVVFGISAVLIVLSILLGVSQYRAALDRLEVNERQLMQQMEGAEHWYDFRNQVDRVPDPMLILVAGVDYDLGRKADVYRHGDPKFENSAYSDDPLFALFRFFDFSFVVQVVLSLMAILMAYDAISGERESGTLKMVMANPVARTTLVLSKFVGLWIGLVVPLVLAMLLAVLVIMLLGVNFAAADWLRFSALLAISLLYVTVFLAVGLLVSTTTRRPAISFLVLLSAWAIAVLIIPRLSTAAAGEIVDTMSVAELEGKLSRFSNDRLREVSRASMESWDQRQKEIEGLSDDEKRQYFEKNREKFQQESKALYDAAMHDIDEYVQVLREQRRNQTSHMEGVALNLARLSPASAYQLASMRLAGTGLETKDWYAEQLRDYAKVYGAFQEEKSGGFISSQEEQQKPTWAELPKFHPAAPSFRALLSQALPDIGLLAIYALLAFAGAYVAFLRYDVR